MIGDIVRDDGRELIVIWDGVVASSPTVAATPTGPLCWCGCGQPVKKGRKYASYRCAGHATRERLFQGHGIGQRFGIR